MFWVAKYNFPDISLNLPEKPLCNNFLPTNLCFYFQFCNAGLNIQNFFVTQNLDIGSLNLVLTDPTVKK